MYMANKKENKKIRFITPHYKHLFDIEDGEEIFLFLSNGVIIRRVCKYVDEYHLYVGNSLYHICEFAEIMSKNGTIVRPAKNTCMVMLD